MDALHLRSFKSSLAPPEALHPNVWVMDTDSPASQAQSKGGLNTGLLRCDPAIFEAYLLLQVAIFEAYLLLPVLCLREEFCLQLSCAQKIPLLDI